MRNSTQSERGFSLIELLIVITTVVVLAQMSIEIYNLYKKKAYDSASDMMLNKIKVALEAGRIDSDFDDNPEWNWVWLNNSGPVEQDAPFLPGLILEPHMEVWVERNDECEAGLWGVDDWCITEWIEVRHCKGELIKSWWRSRNGWEDYWEWEAVGWPPC